MMKYRLCYNGPSGLNYKGFQTEKEALLWAAHQERLDLIKALSLMEYDATKDEYSVIAKLKDLPVKMELPHEGLNKQYYVSYNQNNIYHSILVEAPSVKMAERYLQSKKSSARRVSARDAYPGDIKPGIPVLALTEREERNIRDDLLSEDISELDLSVRTYKCLKRAGIETVRELVCKNEGQLIQMPNLGWKSLNEIIERLDTYGECLEPEPEADKIKRLASTVREQVLLLFEDNDITQSQLEYAETCAEEITRDYLRECDDWEVNHSKEIPLTAELEIMHKHILRKANELKVQASSRPSLKDMVAAAEDRHNLQLESSSSTLSLQDIPKAR